MNRKELKKTESADDDWEQFIQQTLENQRLIKAGKLQPVRKELQDRIDSEAAVGLRMPGEPTLEERLRALDEEEKEEKRRWREGKHLRREVRKQQYQEALEMNLIDPLVEPNFDDDDDDDDDE